MFSPVTFEEQRCEPAQGGKDYIGAFSMFSRPSTPFFDLMQHRYKELWMEEQRARTVVQHVVKKKVGIVQQSFPLMCTALLGTTPHCPTPQGTHGLLPALGRALSWENIPLTTTRLMKPNTDEHPPARSPTGCPLDISSAQVTVTVATIKEQSANAERTAPALSLAWCGNAAPTAAVGV